MGESRTKNSVKNIVSNVTYYNEPINQDKELKKISDYDIIIIK